MKLVIATPLYPPDIAPPAPYVKELARRLAPHHEVVVVAYGRLPERVPRVCIVAVPKNRILPLRLAHYTYQLLKAARGADVVYAQNGASVELPATLVALITRRPLIVGIADVSAHNRASQKKAFGFVERFALARAYATVATLPLERPNIMPLEEYPTAAMNAYESSWHKHMEILQHLFSHA